MYQIWSVNSIKFRRSGSSSRRHRKLSLRTRGA